MGWLHDLVFENKFKKDIHNPESPLRKALLIKSARGRLAVNAVYFSATVAVGYAIMKATTKTPEDLGLTVNGQPSNAYNRKTVAQMTERNQQLQVELDKAKEINDKKKA
eukprot:TRINITY_DN3343_c0_g1_i1.p1 TRINITY_DN3343_c0_g1~~TRINITY_DN3343_c0_g1_i1.p1  ORF type:complete len:109 (-),score=32.18 TRINITY_DN3343_c0_g1_i1:509-835(-)